MRNFDLPTVKSEEMVDVIKGKATTDGIFAVAYSILVLAESTDRVSNSINKLGISDSNHEVGAIEAVAVALHRIVDYMEYSAMCNEEDIDDPDEDDYDEEEEEEEINIDIVYQKKPEDKE